MEKILIVALNLKNVIGVNCEIPWRLPSDFKRFKEKTKGYPIIMGRKTYESIISLNKKPLPGRTSIVISSTLKDPGFDEVKIVENMENALLAASKLGAEKVFFGGGTRIYEEGLKYADTLMFTYVLGWQDGDAFFPAFDRNEWEPVFSETHLNEPNHSSDFMFMDLKRKK